MQGRTGRQRTASLDAGRARLVGHGPFMDAVCTTRQCLPVKISRVHRILHPLPNRPHSLPAILNYLALFGGPDVLGYGAFKGVCVLRDRTARLTQPTPKAKSARASCAGGNVGVGCVKTPAPTRQAISAPWCVERNTSNSPTMPNHSGLLHPPYSGPARCHELQRQQTGASAEICVICGLKKMLKFVPHLNLGAYLEDG